MPVTINGDGSIAGLSVGGLGSGVVNNASLANSTIETAKLTAAAQNSLKTLSFFNQWRVTSDLNANYTGTITNWAQVSSDGYSGLGGSLTHSSGIFSFPSTGIYYIQGGFRILTGNNDTTVTVILQTTLDNSSYNAASYTSGGNATQGSSNTNQTSVCGFIFDVTDTSTHKFRFQSESMNAESFVHGSTSNNQSWFTVIKLSET